MNSIRIIDKTRMRPIIIIMLIALLFYSFFCLSFNQITEEKYASDIRVHISFAKNGTGYSILYTCLGVIISIAGDNYPVWIALFEALLMLLPIFPVSRWIKKSYGISLTVSLFISMGLLFLSSIYWPNIFSSFYISSIITQPWHNITYYGMRLFAAIAICFFAECFPNYQKDFTILNWITISLPLMIATWIKPNFFIAFSWTLLGFLIIDAFNGKWKKQVLVNCIKLGTTVFPSLLILYLHSRILYGGSSGNGESSGIEFVFFTSGFFGNGVWYAVLKLIRDLLFPFIVFGFSIKHNKLSRIEKFIYVQYFIALLQVICLRETGPRAAAYNFYWTIFICSFFLFAVSVSHFINDIKINCLENNQKPIQAILLEKGHRVYFTCGSLLIMLHLISGIVYFILISRGSHYLI